MCSLTACEPAGLWRYTYLLFPLCRVRVIVPGLGVRDVVAYTVREYQTAHTHTPRAYSRVDDACADFDL